MNTRFLYISLILLCTTISGIAQPKPTRVACVGNSITFGYGVSNRAEDSYPALLGRLLGVGYDVRNFGYSARTLLMDGDYPYMKEQLYQDALNYNPQIVVIKLGTNDTKPVNWRHKKSFTKDLRMMVTAFKQLSSAPKIYLCYPAKAYNKNYGISDSIITNEIIPMIDKVAKDSGATVIDIHAATSNMPELFPDAIHPNAEGAAVLAKTVYASIIED